MIKEFKHLDALRAIMSIYITIVHFYILYTLNINKQLEFTNLRFLTAVQLGQVLMTVFFVVSGFLITYILLLEKEQGGNVNLKRFYLRRAFRILPMYYLAVGAMYLLYKKACVSPEMMLTPLCTELKERTLYYVFMIPNWAHVIEKTLPHISNYWSIGAEEQFYILWPLVLFFSRNHLRTFSGIYIFYCFLLIGIVILINMQFHNNTAFMNIAKMMDYTRFGAFAFGGIVAFFLIHIGNGHYKNLHDFMILKKTQFVCLILPFIITVIPNENVMMLKHLLVIPCCSVIIYNLALDKYSILKLDNRYLNYIGKTTYSLYILNQIVIDFAIKICLGIHVKNPIAIFFITMSILFPLSILTYEGIEKPFMKMRRRFG